MNPYTPLPNDEFRKDAMTVRVLRVFPFEVAFENAQGLAQIPRADFDRMAAGAFRAGALLFRDGVQIWPAQTAAPETAEPSQPLTTEIPTPMTTPAPIQSGSFNTHARLSPSDSKRWTSCLASIAFQEANAHRVKDDSSSYADEGTEAHDWAAKVLVGEITFEQVPEPFRDPVGNYTKHCQSLLPDAARTQLDSCITENELGFEPPDHAFFVEEQIPLFYQEEQTGTTDFLAIAATDGIVSKVYGRDYKHGAGVLVTSQDNTQLAIYVYSAIHRLRATYKFPDTAEINLSVIQPRHREADTQTPWIITLADLRTFCEDIEYRAIQARTAAERVRVKIGATGKNVSCKEILEAAPGAKFAPSEGDGGACRWCKCKAFCEVRLAALTEGMETPAMDPAAMLAAMPELDKPSAKLPVEERVAMVSEILGSQGTMVTDEYLVTVIARAKGIRAWLSDVEEYMEGRLLAGEEVEGLKLVEGREGNRDWANEESADTFLKNQGLKQDDRYNYKLKSPAQIEKLIADKLKSTTRTKNRFEELITRSAGKKKLAIDTDKRDAVPATVALMPALDDEFEV